MNLLDRALGWALPFVPRRIVGRFSRPYIAGSTVDEAIQVVRSLRQKGALATLDILGEFITTREEAESATRAHEDLFRRIASEKLSETNVSIKLSALGLTIDRQLCLDNLRRVMKVVAEHDTFLRIDMEDSPWTSATLGIYRTLRAEHPGRVGVAIQSRLRRTLDDVDDLTTEPSNFRLCKGIYREPRPIAYTDFDLIRRNFVAAMDRMFERKAYVGIATHDEVLVWEGLRLVRKYGLTREQYEFQMLLGVDEELRSLILRDGHRLRVYVPFGEHWYPYSVRRLRENPEIAGHAFRALFKKA